MPSSHPLQRYLDQRWPRGLVCPLCGSDDWFWPPDGPRALEGLGTGFDDEDDVSALPISFFLLICSGCGFIAPIFEQAVEGAVQQAAEQAAEQTTSENVLTEDD